MAKVLSEHDKKLLARIKYLDQFGYIEWPEMSHLANQLDDKDEKDFWNRVCAHYNHLEEASIGEL